MNEETTACETNETETPVEQAPVEQMPTEVPAPAPAQAPEKGRNEFAIAGFVCGLLGFLTRGFMLGLLGIIFSAVSRKKGRTGFASAGLALGIIRVVLSVILFLLVLALYVGIAYTAITGEITGILEEILGEFGIDPSEIFGEVENAAMALLHR